MKNINKFCVVLFLLTTLLTTSCLKDNDTTPFIPKAGIRMVNAFVPSNSVYYTIDGKFLTNTSINYKEYTQNLVFVYPGNKSLKVYNSSNNLVADTTLNLRDSSYYTSFAFGTELEGLNLVTEDKSIDNLAGKSAIRFLNLANNTGSVNVSLETNGNQIYSNRLPETISTANISAIEVFTPQTSGNRKVIITDPDNNVLIEREYTFLKERYYSILLIGDKNSTTSPLYLGIILQ